jgi:hypothetical protein
LHILGEASLHVSHPPCRRGRRPGGTGRAFDPSSRLLRDRIVVFGRLLLLEGDGSERDIGLHVDAILLPPTRHGGE